MSQIVAGNRRISQRALLPAMAALAVVAWMLAAIACMLALAPAARAGAWVERSCSYDGEYIAPEGWEAKAYYGYPEPPHAYCEKVAEGGEGGLTVHATPYSGDEDFAGQGWIYKPPAGSIIAGGKVEARLKLATALPPSFRSSPNGR